MCDSLRQHAARTFLQGSPCTRRKATVPFSRADSAVTPRDTTFSFCASSPFNSQSATLDVGWVRFARCVFPTPRACFPNRPTLGGSEPWGVIRRAETGWLSPHLSYGSDGACYFFARPARNFSTRDSAVEISGAVRLRLICSAWVMASGVSWAAARRNHWRASTASFFTPSPSR